MDRGGTQGGMWSWLLPIDCKTNMLPCSVKYIHYRMKKLRILYMNFGAHVA